MVKLTEGVNADLRGGELRARDSSNSGGGMASMDNVPSVMDFAMDQETGISDALSQLTMAYRGLESPIDVWNQLEESMGLPAQKKVAQTLRDQIGSLEDTIQRVRPNIEATTKQSMVTEGQRRQMEVAQKKPFLEHLEKFTTSLGRIDEGIRAMSTDLANKVQLFMAGQQMSLEPLKLQFTAMVDRAARLTSAFGVDAQNQLQVYMANVQRGWELEDRDRDEAFALIMAENSYSKELRKVGAEYGFDVSGLGNEGILSRIGESAAEQMAYDRAQKRKEDGTETEVDTRQYYDNNDINSGWWPTYIS